MKVYALALAVSMAVLFTAGDARAGFMSAQTLNEDCDSAASSYTEGICSGYIQGIIDAGKVLDVATDKRQWKGGWTACLPDGVQVRQVIAVVKKWLREHPEHWHYDAAGVVAEAFAETWPCR